MKNKTSKRRKIQNMRTFTKNISCRLSVLLIIALLMVFILCSCGEESDPDGVVGTWTASWVYNGNQIESTLVFDDDGHVEDSTYINGTLSSSSSGSGTYVVEDDEVICEFNGRAGTYTYEITTNGLNNGGHTYTRE